MKWKLALVALLILPAIAGADGLVSDQLSFSCYICGMSDGLNPVPTAGSFVYDKSTKQFDSFLITWDSVTMDFAYSIDHNVSILGNRAIDTGKTAENVYDQLLGKAPGFTSYDFFCEQDAVYNFPCGFYSAFDFEGFLPNWAGGKFPNGSDVGGGLVLLDPPTTTPEPSALLILAGLVGLVLLSLHRN
jgi:hypothetical protein